MKNFDTKLNFQRVSLAKIFFKLYRTYDHTIFWTPLRFKNGLLAYSSREQLDLFVSKIYMESRKQHTMVDSHFIDFENNSKFFTKESSSWHYSSSELNLQDVIKELVKHKTSVNKEITGKELPEAVGKRCNIVFLNLSEKELKIINSSESLQKIIINLLNSTKEHIYLFVLTKSITDLPSPLIKEFDWVAGLEDENIKDVKAIWHKHDLGIFDENRVVEGILYEFDKRVLLPLHSIRVNPSDYKIKFDEFIEVEEAAYRRLLESLSQ